MKAYCQQTFEWIHFGRSEVFNSINLWTGKNFSKQELWTRRAETGESENFFIWNANRRKLASSLVHAYKYWKTKICRLHQRSHISIIEIHIETSVIQMPTMLNVLAQDAKFGELLEFDRTAGPSNSDQNNYICRLFQKCTGFY